MKNWPKSQRGGLKTVLTKLFSNPLGLLTIAALCMIAAAIDMQFVDAGPDNWFSMLHVHGQAAVIFMLAMLAYMLIRWGIWPALWWAFKPGRPMTFEGGLVPSNAEVIIVVVPTITLNYYKRDAYWMLSMPYRFLITVTFLSFYVGFKFYRNF